MPIQHPVMVTARLFGLPACTLQHAKAVSRQATRRSASQVAYGAGIISGCPPKPAEAPKRSVCNKIRSKKLSVLSIYPDLDFVLGTIDFGAKQDDPSQPDELGGWPLWKLKCRCI